QDDVIIDLNEDDIIIDYTEQDEHLSNADTSQDKY
ncbi:YtxH domain-containing protein, partial [Streptococcus pyogenes]